MFHPEQLPDEIYMGNENPRTNLSGWRSSRYGEQPLDKNGEKLLYSDWPNVRPWFIRISEVRAAIEHENFVKGPNWQEKVKIYQEMIDKRTCL